jgi:hypothetical protein
VELDAVAGPEQQRVLTEHLVARAHVVDRQAPADQLVATGGLDRVDRVARAADPERALGRPRPRRVVLGDEDRVARIEREHERQAGEEADEPRPVLRRQHRLVQLVPVAHAVVADDVVDVRPALGVRRIRADRVHVALDRSPRLGVVERHRQVDDAARDRDPALGVERVVHRLEVVEELCRRERERVVGDEHRAETGGRLDQAVGRLLVEGVLRGKHEEVEGEVEDHLAVLDEDGTLAGLAVRDPRFALLSRLLRDHR